MVSITVIIIIITCIVSFIAFSNEKILNDLIFYPPAITNQNQWYRFITSGLIHGSIPHLAFNMIALYSFGDAVEKYLFSNPCVFGGMGKLVYGGMYVFALIISELPIYFKNKDNYHYKSLGASGAVSAVMFASIVLVPQIPINIMFVPIDIPGFIMGPLFLIISAYLAKQGGGNINHSAHFWGAAFGFVFTAIMVAILGHLNLIQNFIYQIKGYPHILPFECNF